MEKIADKKTEKNGRSDNGRFLNGNKGGPGRPKGSVNLYTQIKNDILEVWNQEGGREKFAKYFREDMTFPKALEKIICLLPKDGSDRQKSFNNVINIIRADSTSKNKGKEGENE